ncbi:helix-turn-helix domain-containing protein [Clostridium ljungdahlii]|uniref:HTH-type transcriptional regulator SinR n=1 Tax=Clostridium ljungdahlii TaxID=1538 RepID=A0A168PD35_9CLOT|nr:helix-turn-helix transcriptional regulator [Clostridium ljungdahlii]OAA87599.1 HTH-type transcriptional regulator SinR [Clostridium ljungdahlii]
MIGNNIKKIRLTNKLGLNETARKAGISAGYLSSLERGEKKNPSMDSLQKIADALNVSVNEFFDEKNDTDGDEFTPTLSVKEQEKLDKQAQDIVNNLSISLSKNKNSLEDEDYKILEASINSALQSLTLKNRKKYTPKKYRKNKK